MKSENTAHLPGPEEWIHESIHAGQCEVLEALLDGTIPVCIVPPESTVGVLLDPIIPRPTKPEPAVVESVAVLSGDVDTKR